MRTSLCGVLVVALVLPSRPSAACPYVPPAPLMEQLETAQALVVARVVGRRTEPLGFGEEGGSIHSRVEHLRVVRTLRGFAPERFLLAEGELMDESEAYTSVEGAAPRLYFINSVSDDAEPWASVEEVLVDDVDDIAVFIDRVNELKQLRARGASEVEEREWLVRCAMRRATRGHAVHALVSESGRLPREGEPPLAEGLTLAQRRAILDGFRQEPTTDGSFVGVLALGRGVEHPAFDRVAVGAMETLLAEPEGMMGSDAPHALFLLMERLGVEDMDARWRTARGEEPESEEALAHFEVEASARLRALWETLRAEGWLVPSPHVPHARSAVDRIALSVD